MTEMLPVPPLEPDLLAEEAAAPTSPRWSVLTKFLMSLVAVVLTGALLVRFQQMIAPLVLAVILAYLLRPLVALIANRTRLSWAAAAAIVYLVLLVVLIGVLTVAGIAIVGQIQGLYGTVLQIITENPLDRLQTLINQPIQLGPLGVIDLSRQFKIGPFGPFGPVNLQTGDFQPLYDQLISTIQPALSQGGVLISSLASRTAETIGWGLFVLVISYYLLNDMRNIALSIEKLVPEGYVYDVRRLIAELGPIWNAFLRGQLTLAIVMGIVVGLTMAALGVRYSVVLGLLAGSLEFIPILGPVTAGTVAVLIALFQPGNWLGLNPVAYAGVVLVAAILLSQIENNFLVPRIIGGSLNLHPVIILVGAVIAASLAGIIGLLLSAPALATLRLVGRYVYRKMFDLDPWPDPPRMWRPPPEIKWARWVRRRLVVLWTERRGPSQG